jgi:hypothetical protein
MNTSGILSRAAQFFSYGKRLHPERDWLLLITVSIVLSAGILVWNIWAFDTVVQGGTIGGTATSSPPVFSQSSLNTIHSVFAARAAENAKYVTGVYTFTDPSQ